LEEVPSLNPDHPSSQAAADCFLSESCERFVIHKGGGKPIDWLLGMPVSQALIAGTVYVQMEFSITKFALGILSSEEIAKSKSTGYSMLAQPLSERHIVLARNRILFCITARVGPGVATSIAVLTRFSNFPGIIHVRACKRVAMYLLNIPKH
jgi:hypothetical protein